MPNSPDGRSPEQPTFEELMLRAEAAMADGAELIAQLRENIAEARWLRERVGN